MTDRQLANSVEDVVHRRFWILPDEVDVEVTDGVVTLRGWVPNRLVARALARMSRDVVGVNAVVSELSWSDPIMA
jgi:osmotically-inducible protein OsmY